MSGGKFAAFVQQFLPVLFPGFDLIEITDFSPRGLSAFHFLKWRIFSRSKMFHGFECFDKVLIKNGFEESAFFISPNELPESPCFASFHEQSTINNP
jgi:hypothetical protein